MRGDLSFDFATIMAIAIARTRASAPPPGRWRKWLGDELRLVWGSARAMRDAKRAEALITTLSATEHDARRCELAAALAEGAIPSRPTEAAALRDEAAAIRAVAARKAA